MYLQRKPLVMEDRGIRHRGLNEEVFFSLRYLSEIPAQA